jgi:hypothetical protein
VGTQRRVVALGWGVGREGESEWSVFGQRHELEQLGGELDLSLRGLGALPERDGDGGGMALRRLPRGEIEDRSSWIPALPVELMAEGPGPMEQRSARRDDQRPPPERRLRGDHVELRSSQAAALVGELTGLPPRVVSRRLAKRRGR